MCSFSINRFGDQYEISVSAGNSYLTCNINTDGTTMEPYVISDGETEFLLYTYRGDKGVSITSSGGISNCFIPVPDILYNDIESYIGRGMFDDYSITHHIDNIDMNIPSNAVNTLTEEPILNGNNMVNFNTERNRGRYYKKSSYSKLPVKENPYTRRPIEDVRHYKAKVSVVGGSKTRKVQHRKRAYTARAIRR